MRLLKGSKDNGVVAKQRVFLFQHFTPRAAALTLFCHFLKCWNT